MEIDSPKTPASLSFDLAFNSDFDVESNARHQIRSPKTQSFEESIQQTPVTYEATPRKRKFFHVSEGRCLQQRKDVVGDVDGALAVGITNIQDGVGMYVELSDQEYFAWHINPPTLPPAYPGFTILNPPANQPPSKRVLKHISDLHSEYLQRTVGELEQTPLQSKLTIVTLSPSLVNVAVIEGILSWAGVELREDGEHWRASHMVRCGNSGFIVGRAERLQWYLRLVDNDTGPGSEQDWEKDWEAVEVGVDDERGEIRQRGQKWRNACQRCVVM